jgi:hypothetical protein
VVEIDVASLISLSSVIISSRSLLEIGDNAKGESPFVASYLEEEMSPSKAHVSNVGVKLIISSLYFTSVFLNVCLTSFFFPSFDLFFSASLC